MPVVIPAEVARAEQDARTLTLAAAIAGDPARAQRVQVWLAFVAVVSTPDRESQVRHDAEVLARASEIRGDPPRMVRVREWIQALADAVAVP